MPITSGRLMDSPKEPDFSSPLFLFRIPNISPKGVRPFDRSTTHTGAIDEPRGGRSEKPNKKRRGKGGGREKKKKSGGRKRKRERERKEKVPFNLRRSKEMRGEPHIYSIEARTSRILPSLSLLGLRRRLVSYANKGCDKNRPAEKETNGQ